MDERTEPGTKPEKALHHMHTDTINIFLISIFHIERWRRRLSGCGRSRCVAVEGTTATAATGSIHSGRLW